MTSRNQREGRYVGAWEGKQVRFRGQLAIVPIVERFWPHPDSDIAWCVLSRRLGVPLPLAPHRVRYIAKGRLKALRELAELGQELGI